MHLGEHYLNNQQRRRQRNTITTLLYYTDVLCSSGAIRLWQVVEIAQKEKASKTPTSKLALAREGQASPVSVMELIVCICHRMCIAVIVQLSFFIADEKNEKTMVGSGRHRCLFEMPRSNHQQCTPQHLHADMHCITLYIDAIGVRVSLMVVEIKRA